MKFALSTDQAAAKLDSVEVTRGTNRIDASGSYQLPADFADWRQNPLDVDLTIAAPKLSEFSTTPAGAVPAIEGQLEAKGNITLRNGVYGGGFDLTASNIQAKGARLQNANLQIGIENNQATVRPGTIRLDDKNTIDLTGNAALAPPYTFDAGFTVDLANLANFEPLLRANNVLTPLSGLVHVSGHGSGHLATAPGKEDQQITGDFDVTARNLQAEGARIDSVDTHLVIADNAATIKDRPDQAERQKRRYLRRRGALEPALCIPG